MDRQHIQLIVYDFDGVMTDNHAYVFEDGREAVRVNRSDGLAISLFKKQHINQLILSTEKNSVVSKRAEKLKIPVLQGQENKKQTLMQYCEKNNISLSNVVYIGNDINDLEVMQSIGMPCCPNDAVPEIKAVAVYCFKSKGGEGVIRELYDRLNKKESQ